MSLYVINGARLEIADAAQALRAARRWTQIAEDPESDAQETAFALAVAKGLIAVAEGLADGSLGTKDIPSRP